MRESPEDLDKRYSRQVLLPQIGKRGQELLRQAKVLIVGAGGLGSPAGLYLAAAGVGTIGIADGDTVDLSNIARQVAHFTADTGRPKTASLGEKMAAINPNIDIIAHNLFINQGNAAEIFAGYDFILDCTDTLCAKYMVNDVCVALGKPCCIGGVYQFGAQITTIEPGSPCYRCVFPDASPSAAAMSCERSGVMGPVVGMLGCLQATEAIKHITGTGATLAGRLLTIDTLTMRFSAIALRRRPDCPAHHA